MEVLTICHQDFTMSIECTKFEGIWGKAKRNVGEDKLALRWNSKTAAEHSLIRSLYP